MISTYWMIAFALQNPDAGAAAPVPTDDPALAAFLAGEERYAERLSGMMNRDLRRDWARYVDDEQDKARERATGEQDPDDAARTFSAYLDERYRRRTRLGIILFGVGFAPLGFGLYTGLTLGEGSEVALGVAGVGGALIVSGAVLWGIRGGQQRRFRAASAALDQGRPRAGLHWRGLAPLYVPQFRSVGVSAGFAF